MTRRSREREPEASGEPEGGETKVCASCGRRIEWRAKWANSWAEVKYCSDACRRRGVTAVDARLEQVILELLAAKASGHSVDPAAAALIVGGDRAKDVAEPARRAARRLVARGLVDILQKGRIVDPSTARGPIQVRRRSH